MLVGGKISDAAGDGPMTRERHSGSRMRNRGNILAYHRTANKSSFLATGRNATQHQERRRSLCSLPAVIWSGKDEIFNLPL